MTKGRPVTREIQFRGKTYPTITAILKEFGFRFGTFSTYRQTKCTDKSLEEALESFLETHRSPNIRIPVSRTEKSKESTQNSSSTLLPTVTVEQINILKQYRGYSSTRKRMVQPIGFIIQSGLDPYEIIYLMEVAKCSLKEAMYLASTDLTLKE